MVDSEARYKEGGPGPGLWVWSSGAGPRKGQIHESARWRGLTRGGQVMGFPGWVGGW